MVACSQFGLVHSYTLEASCNVSAASQILIGGLRKAYSPFEYEAVGKGLAEALLDMNSTVANLDTIAKGFPTVDFVSPSNLYRILHMLVLKVK